MVNTTLVMPSKADTHRSASGLVWSADDHSICTETDSVISNLQHASFDYRPLKLPPTLPATSSAPSAASSFAASSVVSRTAARTKTLLANRSLTTSAPALPVAF